MLSEAARLGARVAVLASSGALYPSQNCPLDEDLAVSPVDVYGLSKQLMEQIGQFISRTSEMSCVAARLFNVYGPFETNPHLIPEIIESLKIGPTVYLGNTHTKRDYIYVDDVAESLYQCATLPQGGYTAVNVGTGIEYSAEEIVGTLAQLLGSEIEIRIEPSRKRAVDKLFQRACTLRFEKLTKTRSRTSLYEGLGLLLEHEGWPIGNAAAEPMASWRKERHA